MAGVSAQRATVTLSNGESLDLTVTNPDLVRWDLTAHKHKWPGMEDAPMLWATFVTWRAAARAGLYAGTWEDWSNTDCASVDLEVEEEDADPTRPGPGLASA